MGNQTGRGQSDAYESESACAPTPKNGGSNEADQLEAAGQTILRLLHKAAGVAEANSHQALDMAKKLSHELRSAEEKIAWLEAQVRSYQDKAERAEQWLHKIYTEVEEQFIRRPEEKRRAGKLSIVTN